MYWEDHGGMILGSPSGTSHLSHDTVPHFLAIMNFAQIYSKFKTQKRAENFKIFNFVPRQMMCITGAKRGTIKMKPSTL